MRDALKHLWSATDFIEEDISRYARGLITPETRNGLTTMALLLLCLQVGTWLLQVRAGQGNAYFYTFCILVVLSVHILWSVRFVKETRVLHLLAMAYLIMSSTAIALVAHRMGTFNIGLMFSAVLLIAAIPLMPWGLKQALGVTLLIYTLFTLSILSVTGRFDSETIWTLQFLFLASALITWALVARNVGVRKHDIETRFHLEAAQRQHELLSLTDPLTGAWNRRFMTNKFHAIAADAKAAGHELELALLDVDDFKSINDTHGHHCGDEILKRLVEVFKEYLPGNAHVVRVGGDEFAILFHGGDFQALAEQCLKHLETDPKLIRGTEGHPVHISAGFAKHSGDGKAVLEDLYRAADDRLYSNKGRRSHRRAAIDTLPPSDEAPEAV